MTRRTAHHGKPRSALARAASDARQLVAKSAVDAAGILARIEYVQQVMDDTDAAPVLCEKALEACSWNPVQAAGMVRQRARSLDDIVANAGDMLMQPTSLEWYSGLREFFGLPNLRSTLRAAEPLPHLYALGAVEEPIESALSQPARVPVQHGLGWRHVAAGNCFSVAIAGDGHVYSWGSGANGALGHGDECRSSTPRVIAALLAHKVVHCAAGWSHAAAVTDSGRLFMWGWGGEGRLGNGSEAHAFTPCEIPMAEPIVSVECGARHTICIGKSGVVYGFGDNSFNQLGASCDKVTAPTVLDVPGLARMAVAGDFFCVVLSTDGLFTLGANDCSQSAVPVHEPVTRWTRVAFDEHASIVKLCAGGMHAGFLVEKGTAYLWGSNSEGQLGLASGILDFASPNPVTLSEPVADMALGSEHTVLLSASHKVYTFGRGSEMQLGHGFRHLEASSPHCVASLSDNAQRVFAGDYHTLVLCGSHAMADFLATLDSPLCDVTLACGALRVRVSSFMMRARAPALMAAIEASRGVPSSRGDAAPGEREFDVNTVAGLESITPGTLQTLVDFIHAASATVSQQANARYLFDLATRFEMTEFAAFCQRAMRSQAGVVGSQLAADLLAAWRDSSSTDFSLEMTDGEPLRAHRFVLSARSPYFSALFHGAMRMSENQRSMQVTEFSREAMQYVLVFMYTATIPSLLSCELAFEVARAATFYGLPRLGELCAQVVLRGLEAASVVPVLLGALDHMCEPLAARCFDFADLIWATKASAVPDAEQLLERYPLAAERLLRLSAADHATNAPGTL